MVPELPVTRFFTDQAIAVEIKGFVPRSADIPVFLFIPLLQGHKCPICVKNGTNTEYAFADMQGDHIVPWSKGGRTVEDNLQMLCSRCNNEKSAK